MRTATWLGILCITSTVILSACGGDEGSGTSGASGQASSGSGSGSGSGGGGATVVNGCDPATAEDRTGDTDVPIAFGDAIGFKYSPACIKVKVGTTLTFSGDFASHPLTPGIDLVEDPASPIQKTDTNPMSGSVSFALSPAGTYGWFCGFHGGGGMEGAAFVE
jgi:plastocyanin